MRAMKDSNIPWIGQIPIDWKVIRIKNACWLKGRIGWDGLKSNEYVETGPYLITGTDFINGHIAWRSCVHISEERFEQDSDIHIQEGDLLITKDGTIGKVAVVTDCPEKVSLNSGVLLIRNTNKLKYYQRYLYYILLSPLFWLWYDLSQTGNSTIKHLYQEQFYNFSFCFPDLFEQQRIADYLDKKCREIDKVLEKTMFSIEEYKKLKQSIITKAVTKGIRGERSMKDSGIAWISQIPKEWGCHKVLFGLSMPITDGPHTTPELFDAGVPFVSAEAISCGNGGIDFSHIRGYISEDFYLECCKKYIPQKDDIFMIKSGATTGRVSIVDTNERFTIWSPLAVFRANSNKLFPKYLFYSLQADYFQKQVEFGWTFGTQQNIGMRTLEQLKVCYPPILEQQEIADYLDKKYSEIDSLIASKEKFITELESYKKSLIYEYVTGKKEVPSNT